MVTRMCAHHVEKIRKVNCRFISLEGRGEGRYIFGNWEKTNGQHLRDSARMRCHSPSTKHTGGLRLFSREFPESDLFWLKRSFQKICVIKQMQEKIRRGE